MPEPDLAALCPPGRPFAVRVQPRARKNAVEIRDGRIRVQVTAAPERGKATAAVTVLLARALRVAPSRLTLLRGQAARDKLYRLD